LFEFRNIRFALDIDAGEKSFLKRLSDILPRRSDEALAALISAIERACRAKANAAVRQIIE